MRAIGISSDYALAPYLGITRSAISALRHNVAVMGDMTAMRVAELLQAEPAFVLACLHYERAKDEGLKSAWRTVAEQFAPRQSGPSRRATDWQFDAAGLPVAGVQNPLRASTADRRQAGLDLTV